MDTKHVKILKGLASENRIRILDYISKNIDHPNDIAVKIKATRQAVDKQLEILHKLRLIEKEAITPPSGRPKVNFKITDQGTILLHNITVVFQQYLIEIEKEFKNEVENLDDQLLKGEISEEIYYNKSKEIRKKYMLITQ